jgi:glutamate N-acetyltransferase/amino-acid N-acetyltransferase
MPVNYHPAAEALPVAGVYLGTVEAAIKKPGKQDLLVVKFDEGSRVAGVFTRNAFCAAPVQICRQQLAQTSLVRAWVINSGNANAGTGLQGLKDAQAVQSAVASVVGCKPMQVLPFSTGVIGQKLPVERMVSALPGLSFNKTWVEAAKAIMTTDTVHKVASRTVQTYQGTVTVTGIAKGAGMIRPDMATLLAFVATDARLTESALQLALKTAVAGSFNSITIDGDTSTNDSCVLVATQKVGLGDVRPDHPDFPDIQAAIASVMLELAQAIVRDGEGATRFITLEVLGAESIEEAKTVGYSVAHSPLFKTAAFAGDANWGRILAAVGYAKVPNLDLSRVSIYLDDLPLIVGGEPHLDYTEAKGSAVFAQAEYRIRIGLGRGNAMACVYTCDFSYDYVKINAEYRT